MYVQVMQKDSKAIGPGRCFFPHRKAGISVLDVSGFYVQRPDSLGSVQSAVVSLACRHVTAQVLTERRIVPPDLCAQSCLFNRREGQGINRCGQNRRTNFLYDALCL